MSKSNILYSTESILDRNFFFGFHDISPWNESDTLLAVHSFLSSKNLKNRTSQDCIDISIWSPSENKVSIIDSTSTWNWQQGSRLQWMRGNKSSSIIYNKRTSSNLLISSIYNTETGDQSILDYPIYGLSSSGKEATSMNFARLGEYWKGYGYIDVESEFDINAPTPSDDGIFIIDLESGERSLLVSLAEIASVKSPLSPSALTKRFVAHPTYSPSGDKICFFDRFHSEEGALLSRFFVIDSDGKDLKLLGEGKWSHFDWVNDDELIIWSRASGSVVNKMNKSSYFSNNPLLRFALRQGRKLLAPSLKSKMTQEYFRRVNVLTGENTSFAKGIITEDGHPMISNDKNWIVSDTYHNKEGYQTLMLYNFSLNKRIDLDEYFVPVEYRDFDLKCDLHPRWNHANTQICIDSAHSGKRNVYILDIDLNSIKID